MERIFILYPCVRLPFGVYSPAPPHFLGECPNFAPWERKGSGPWERMEGGS